MPEVLHALRKLLARFLWVKGVEDSWSSRRHDLKHVACDEHSLVCLVARDVQTQLDGAELAPDFACAILRVGSARYG